VAVGLFFLSLSKVEEVNVYVFMALYTYMVTHDDAPQLELSYDRLVLTFSRYGTGFLGRWWVWEDVARGGPAMMMVFWGLSLTRGCLLRFVGYVRSSPKDIRFKGMLKPFGLMIFSSKFDFFFFN